MCNDLHDPPVSECVSESDSKPRNMCTLFGKSYNLSLQNIDVIESVHRKTQRIWTGGAAPSSNPLSFPMYGLYNSNKSRFWSRSHGDKGYTYWDFESLGYNERGVLLRARGARHVHI